MDVQIKSCIDGAREADGTAVLIDVLRASTVLTVMLAQGLDYAIAVANLDLAYYLKNRNPKYLLVGERGGVKLDGFDFGNSPTELARESLEGRIAIVTTSSGIQGIAQAQKASEIVVGSFVNAKAVVRYLLNKNPDRASLIAIGTEGVKPAEEDDQCAIYLSESLQMLSPDFPTMVRKISDFDNMDSGARRLLRLGHVADLNFCLTLDKYDFVPKVVKHDNLYMVRRDA